jgi:RNA-directed DNA polymerase
VKSRSKQFPPASVPSRAKQAGEARGRWPWVEASVWTDRMLQTLETGVKGGSWFSLIDKVYAKRTLRSAFQRVKRNRGAAGVDRVTVQQFGSRQEEELESLSVSLAAGSYRPQGIRRKWIPKPGSREKRPLGIPTVRDRVVQTALRMVLEPIFERDFAEQSFGFRPERGCLNALARVEELLEAGNTWVVDVDLRRFFDTIDHDRLLARIEEKVTDGRVLALIESFLHQEVMDGLETWVPEEGTPQGATLSPLLANITLDPLDHHMAREGFLMVRYADDFVVLCRSRSNAAKALKRVEEWTVREGLSIHPDKSRIVDATKRGGFDFLGYHFERGYKWPREKSLKELKNRVRARTRRTNGHSLERIIIEINRTLPGWFTYFKYAHPTTFPRLDKWIRMRLRSILRKRKGGRGRGRGSDHQRWPNAYFADRGLYSLAAASDTVLQSSLR